MSLLSEAESQRIEEAVRALEKRSATELVVAVVPRSSDYWHARVIVAFTWSLAVAVALLHFLPDIASIWVVLAEVPVALLIYALFGIDALERLLIPKALARESVERRAFELFSSRGLYKTQARTGMLLLISELEHQVVILGDRGIHEKVGDAGWQAHVDHIVASIRRSDGVTGVLDVIERLGRVHAELNPVTSGDTNELPDDIVRR